MFLKSNTHFSGETHWFPSVSKGIEVPQDLKELVGIHIRKYGWNTPIIEQKTTGIVATDGYEALIPVVMGKSAASAV